MKLPILHSHFVTGIVMAKGDEEETVVNCLTTNTEVQHERGKGPGDMFAMVPEQKGSNDIAEEIAIRCNEHPILMKLLRRLLSNPPKFNKTEAEVDRFLYENGIDAKRI